MGRHKHIFCKCGCGEESPAYYVNGINKGRLAFIKTHRPKYIINGEKKCRKCNKWKAIEDFYFTRKEHKIFSFCKICSGIVSRAHRDRIYGSARNYWLNKRYGISIDDFNIIANKSNGMCPICLKRKAVVVDHCHERKKVRGILCHACNRAIGNFGDTIESIKRLAHYFDLL